MRESVSYLVSKRYGALIAICRSNKLQEYAKTGTELDAHYTRELIGTIFMPKTLLHDGAVIVNNERIVAAAAILPVSNRELKDRSMGLRHRAGIGLAEASDAVVIIVSEEVKRGSYAGEISAQIAEELFDELDAPVERVCGLNIVSPFSPVLEDLNFPHPEDIAKAVKRVLNK